MTTLSKLHGRIHLIMTRSKVTTIQQHDGRHDSEEDINKTTSIITIEQTVESRNRVLLL